MSNLINVKDNNLITVRATEYINNAKSQNTLKAYRKDWNNFLQFCDANNVCSLPADVSSIISYLTIQAENHRVSTLERRIASISQAHQAAGFISPTSSIEVRTLMQGIRHVKGTAQHGKSPAITTDIKSMVSTLSDTMLGHRDRALLLIGFAGAFRRSELVSLDVEDLIFCREGLVITLRKSKTDQDGQGRKVAITYGSNYDTCPIRSLQLWLEASGIKSGPVFRSVNRHGNVQTGRLSDKAVALVIKRCAKNAGLNPDNYSGHSLRSGMATSAAQNGVSERAIMNQTGHKSVNMVRRYIREGSLFKNNASATLGL